MGGKSREPLSKQKHWTAVHKRYLREEVLGEGTYGVVFRAQNTESGDRVAMKRSRLDLYPEEGIPATALREVTLLRDFQDCPNIMKLHEISCNSNRLYMVCEFLDYDLKKFLKAHGRQIPYKTTKNICYEILKGLAWCHGSRVMHRDLKPHNILLDKTASTVKLADFGLARAAHAVGKTITHEVITLWYRPPELLLGGCNYSDSVDIWSVGCIMAELLSGQAIFMGDCEIDTLFRIFRRLGTPTYETWPSLSELPEGQSSNHWPSFPRPADVFGDLNPQLDMEGKDLLSRMLTYDPEKRISSLEALQHPWFADIRPSNDFVHQTAPQPVPSSRKSTPNRRGSTSNASMHTRPSSRQNKANKCESGTHLTAAALAAANNFNTWYPKGADPNDSLNSTMASSADISAVDGGNNPYKFDYAESMRPRKKTYYCPVG